MTDATEPILPAPCEIVKEAPYDFGACLTHDETFLLDGDCKWHDGWVSAVEALEDEVDALRMRAVRAELEVERLKLRVATQGALPE